MLGETGFRGYVIATSPRAGGWLLCGALSQTGVAGYPTEYASRADSRTWSQYYGFAAHVEYFFRFPAISRTPNALFGVKLFWDQYVAWGMEANMYLRRDRSTFEAISSVVGPIRFIRLRRRNRLRQAISLVRARQSNQWSRRPGSPPAEAIIPTYSSDAIARAIHELTEHDARWDRELNSIGAATLEISYETLATEYVETVRKILTFLEVVAPRSLEDKPPLRRQADALTEEWVRRAIADIGDAPGG